MAQCVSRQRIGTTSHHAPRCCLFQTLRNVKARGDLRIYANHSLPLSVLHRYTLWLRAAHFVPWRQWGNLSRPVVCCSLKARRVPVRHIRRKIFFAWAVRRQPQGSPETSLSDVCFPTVGGVRVQWEFSRSELEETVWFADKHFDDRASVRVVPKFANGNSETALLI